MTSVGVPMVQSNVTFTIALADSVCKQLVCCLTTKMRRIIIFPINKLLVLK